MRGLPPKDPDLWLEYERLRQSHGPTNHGPHRARLERLESRLVATHQPLAKYWMERYLARAGLDCDRDDAWQAAQIGLLRALRSYDRSKATSDTRSPFSPWVRIYVWCELGAIARQVRGTRRNRAPLTAEEYRRVAAWEAAHGRPATHEDVGVSEASMRDFRMIPRFVELPEDLAIEVDYEGDLDEKRRLDACKGKRP